MIMEIGSKWNGWIVDSFLGEGSFGRVYKIKREELGYTYESALKVIRIPQNRAELTAVQNEGMSERSVTTYFHGMVEDIVAEFALMSKLRGNSNIVSFEDHQVEKLEDDFGWEIFIRMELLTPLFDYLKNNTFTVHDVIQLGIDLCKALETCQRYNIIHRDIKPENIFVSDQGTFKLGDFGIARQLEKTSSGLSKKGTFSYMAPEVYKGQPYNSTVDIYSLGIVLYRFMNNNRTPFLPPYPEQIRFTDRENANVLRMKGNPLPTPCNAKGRLKDIILKACAYEPMDRYVSAYEMRRALESIEDTEYEAMVVYPSGDVHVKQDSSVSSLSSLSDKPLAEDDVTSGRSVEINADTDVIQAASDSISGWAGDQEPEDEADLTVSLFDSPDEDKTTGLFDNNNFHSFSENSKAKSKTESDPMQGWKNRYSTSHADERSSKSEKQEEQDGGHVTSPADWGSPEFGENTGRKTGHYVSSADSSGKKEVRKEMILLAVLALLVVIFAGFFVKHLFLPDPDDSTGKETASSTSEASDSGSDSEEPRDFSKYCKLISSVSHKDPSDGGYEIAAVFQVLNKNGEKPLTSIYAQTEGIDADGFTAYGYAAPGEEGLFAAVWNSYDELPDDLSYELATDDDSFSGEELENYQEIECTLLDGGKNISMETNHDDNGYATEWNDNDFAKYKIDINNPNDYGLSSNETMGIAVVYDDGKLSEGDVFYNDLDDIDPESSNNDNAILPKDLVQTDGVKLMVLPICR